MKQVEYGIETFVEKYNVMGEKFLENWMRVWTECWIITLQGHGVDTESINLLINTFEKVFNERYGNKEASSIDDNINS